MCSYLQIVQNRRTLFDRYVILDLDHHIVVGRSLDEQRRRSTDRRHNQQHPHDLRATIAWFRHGWAHEIRYWSHPSWQAQKKRSYASKENPITFTARASQPNLLWGGLCGIDQIYVLAKLKRGLTHTFRIRTWYVLGGCLLDGDNRDRERVSFVADLATRLSTTSLGVTHSSCSRVS